VTLGGLATERIKRMLVNATEYAISIIEVAQRDNSNTESDKFCYLQQ
jgi:hypothetical protein